MLTVKIDELDALEMLNDRVAFWTDNETEKDLFAIYYMDMIDGGAFDGAEFDPMMIVDNDYINLFSVMDDAELVKQFPDDEAREDRIYARKGGFNLVYMC